MKNKEIQQENKETLKEEIIISFTGLDTDRGIIEINDLTKALQGWREYWEISTSTYLNKELSTKPLPQDIRPQIKIKALKHNSFDIWSDIVIPVALMVGYDILKVLWQWQISLLKEHIKNKKGLISKEDAVEATKKMAEKFDIETKSTIEAVKLIDMVDESLNLFVEPIDSSAQKIAIVNTKQKRSISLTASDKRALKSGYFTGSDLKTQGYEKVNIKFIRVNTETGNALITFDKPTGIHQMGHEYSQIMDPTVTQPKNVYTRALYEDTSLEVWAKMIKSRRSNRFEHWEISTELPSEDTPLFRSDDGKKYKS